jgi:Domain of unknown function (DUF4505)
MARPVTTGIAASAKRHSFYSFSTRKASGQQSTYVDEWFASIVKPKSFYELHSSTDTLRQRNKVDHSIRCYFYNVDLQGRLFLEETMPKNIATSIKDDRFLDFFFQRLRRTSTAQRDWMRANEIPEQDYPFVSACGNELNFVRPAATPIVFHSLIGQATSEERKLAFGGKSLMQSFDEKGGIAISQNTGRLYHKLTSQTLAPKDNQQDARGEYGLIRSSVAVTLSEHIITDFAAPLVENTDIKSDGLSGMGFQLSGSDSIVPIPWLPESAEPGSWSVPSTFHE